MRPGISVRPPPSITTAPSSRSVAIGVEEIRSILFPRTSTFDGPETPVALAIEDADVLEHRCSRQLRLGIEARCQSARQSDER